MVGTLGSGYCCQRCWSDWGRVLTDPGTGLGRDSFVDPQEECRLLVQKLTALAFTSAVSSPAEHGILPSDLQIIMS